MVNPTRTSPNQSPIAPQTDTEPGTTVWERIGAGSGMVAVVLLAIAQWLSASVGADPALADDAGFAASVAAERATWEAVTLLRLVGGLTLVWSMGSLHARLRLAEGEPGRLASIVFAAATAWGVVWLLGAFLNSASILLATDYGHAAGSRLAAILSREVVHVLTPSVVFTLLLAASFAVYRFGAFPSAYNHATAALAAVVLVLALANWWAADTPWLDHAILALAFAWTFATSALLVRPYLPPDYVRGVR